MKVKNDNHEEIVLQKTMHTDNPLCTISNHSPGAGYFLSEPHRAHHRD